MKIQLELAKIEEFFKYNFNPPPMLYSVHFREI